MEEIKLIPNFGLIMLCSLMAIGTGVIVEILNNKKKEHTVLWRQLMKHKVPFTFCVVNDEH